MFTYTNRCDVWMDRALNCLGYLTASAASNAINMALSQCSELTRKLSLFQSIASYYSAVTNPLWSDNYIDIQLALLNLLMQGELQKTLQGLQLALLLLPSETRQHMCAVLYFLKAAADDKTIPLSSSVSK